VLAFITTIIAVVVDVIKKTIKKKPFEKSKIQFLNSYKKP